MGREFFISRIVDQAAAEGRPLDSIERKYLDYSVIRSEAEFDKIEEEFVATHDFDEFKVRIERLLKTALENDLRTDRDARRKYRDEMTNLRGIDSGLSTFVEDAFASDLRFKAPFSWFLK